MLRRFVCPTWLTALLLLAAPACSDDAQGDGNAVKASPCQPSMFNKYGLTSFTSINTKVIANATAPGMEAKIGNTFVTNVVDQGNEKVATFTNNLAAFLVRAYGGPDTYVGREMTTAHTGLNITSEQYDNFVNLAVVPALQQSGVAGEDISSCFAPLLTDAAFKASIVGH